MPDETHRSITHECRQPFQSSQGAQVARGSVGLAKGGVLAIRAGGVAYIEVEAVQGNYFLYCSLVDPNTGESMALTRMTDSSRP